jgi:transcriptional regulator with XRE-family HTH domain
LEAAVALNKDQLDALVCQVFGSIVKHVRQQRNQTKGPFAALLGLSADELDWIEDGTDANVTTLYKFSEAVGISAARVAATLQIVTAKLQTRNDVGASIKQKDWDKLVSIIDVHLADAHDLLKLPAPEQQPLSIPAPPPKMSNEVYSVQPGQDPPMALTRIVDVEDDAEGDFIDDEFDDDDEDDADYDEPPPPAAPPKSTNAPSRTRPEAPMPEVVVKHAVAGQGVTRRGPGRPRKYPVPPA